MDHVVLRNDFGMDKKLSAVSGGLGIVRVMAAAWLISVMISAVGMVLASLIFYAVGEGQNRIRVSVYVVVVLAVLIGGIYAGFPSDRDTDALSVGAGAGKLYMHVTLCLVQWYPDLWFTAGWQFCLPFCAAFCLGSVDVGGE
ncbi:MAG: TIGR04086 family membrane protein [Lachnospiraceae bacterium]